jgi:hypothetical protein
MKVIATALIAVFTTVLILVGFSPRVGGKAQAAGGASTAGAAATPFAAPVANQQAVPATDWQAARGATDGGYAETAGSAQTPVLVNCGPGTQTLVRPVMMNGEMVSQVECVADQRGYVQAGAMMRPVSQAIPVYDTESAAPPRVVRVQETYRRPAPRRVETKPRRSWGKTALVIGGSSAAGAGIGGLIGGKKGALIGAAIGGGASTIFEATKRR